MRYRFEAELRRWEARVHDDWYFVDLPLEQSAEIHEWADALPRAGFGAVKVTARVGATSWSTSIFPGASGVYSLVLNARVRRAEGIEPGDTVVAEVELAG
ncbi:DUF1905 domain-containing protein [Protaetiibacter intestinalis]|uniref:DUF1905 domain-containing protein n=1 Tax=Protaetiibacter intestinalis TaxID=2419774 RepID=A0A387BKI5_9MICO|nr:DUF1905 domain-containing protein [Protaetiibacter intestinalis]AYF99020.1 DUF1905 domain-containing protein [Protaetiibacter intestinalis]